MHISRSQIDQFSILSSVLPSVVISTVDLGSLEDNPVVSIYRTPFIARAMTARIGQEAAAIQNHSNDTRARSPIELMRIITDAKTTPMRR
jgi:hypothetical protein